MAEDPRVWIRTQVDAAASTASTAALEALREALAQTPVDYVLVDER